MIFIFKKIIFTFTQYLLWFSFRCHTRVISRGITQYHAIFKFFTNNVTSHGITWYHTTNYIIITTKINSFYKRFEDRMNYFDVIICIRVICKCLFIKKMFFYLDNENINRAKWGMVWSINKLWIIKKDNWQVFVCVSVCLCFIRSAILIARTKTQYRFWKSIKKYVDFWVIFGSR